MRQCASSAGHCERVAGTDKLESTKRRKCRLILVSNNDNAFTESNAYFVAFPCVTPHQVREDVLSFVLQLLGHEYPRVRRYTAEQLYIKLLEDDCSALSSSSKRHDEVMKMLLDVAWDDGLESPGDVRLSRNRLAELMDVQLPGHIKEARVQSKNRTRANDEFESYHSLVNHVGR